MIHSLLSPSLSRKMNGTTSRRRLPTIHLQSSKGNRFDSSPNERSPSISEKFRSIGQQLHLASSQGVSRSSTDDQVLSSRRDERSETLHSNDESQFRSVQFARTHPTNSAHLRECAKSIRENVTHFKDQLMRNEFDYSKQLRKTETLSSLVYQRSTTDDDRSLIEQTSSHSSLVPSREVLQWKKALDQSEQQREQLIEEFQALVTQYEEKDRLATKSSAEVKDLTEQCDTFERQNGKLQQDLRLALEKLEEMTGEAEQFAVEAQDSQKRLADCEQKYDEFQIQTQENIKQWTAKVKKLEKDLDRQKIDSTELFEKNKQVSQELDTLKSTNGDLRERISELELEHNQLKIDHQDQFDEHSQRYDTEIGQLRSVRTNQSAEIDKLRTNLQQIERELNQSRHAHREKQNIEKSLREEIQHLQSTLDQTEKTCSQLDEELREHEKRRDQYESLVEQLTEEKSKSSTWQTTSEQIKKQLERAEIESERQINAIHLDYGEQMEKLQSQISTRFAALQQHDMEYALTREELLRQQTRMDQIVKDIQEKSQLIEELQLTNNRLTTDLTQQRTRHEKKERDYQTLCDVLVNDLNSCTQCLSKTSRETSPLESLTPDQSDSWIHRVKAHFSWLKDEIDVHQQRETQLRRELDNLYFDSETDRKYFAEELAKREILINDLTDRQNLERNDLFHRLKFFSTQFIDVSLHPQTSIDNEKTDRIDLGFRQFQTLIDSVKRDLQTAKVQLSA